MGVKVEQVLLFGSHARGEAKDGSDIDLLVVSSDFERLTAWERLEVLGIAAGRVWQPIEALASTPTEVAQVQPATFLEEILQTGVRVA
jgi:predicted nucleotidyltransferase